jgi:hypothetical protein
MNSRRFTAYVVPQGPREPARFRYAACAFDVTLRMAVVAARRLE